MLTYTFRPWLRFHSHFQRKFDVSIPLAVLALAMYLAPRTAEPVGWRCFD